MENNFIEIEENKVNIITLNRPETLNAFTVDMVSAITNTLEDWNKKKTNKALIIRARGKAFSSGGNLNLMKEFIDKNQGVEYLESIVPLVNKLILAIHNYPGPTLAVLNGSAVGGGFNIAMACDFRIAYFKSTFRLGFTDIGLTPATSNTFFLPKIIGIPRTLALSILGTKITANDLLSWGLVNGIYNDDTFEAIFNNWVEKLCSLDPWQVTQIRKLCYASEHSSLEDHLKTEYDTILKAGARPLFKERVDSRWQDINGKK